MVPGTGIEPVWLAPRDFKSLVSTNFTIRAFDLIRELAAVCGRKSLDRRVIGNETKRVLEQVGMVGQFYRATAVGFVN